MNWAQQFNTFSFLDNHQYQIAPHTQECMLAAGVKKQFIFTPGKNSLTELQQFIDAQQGKWLFGHLAYELKNELAALSTKHADKIGFPDVSFFEPTILLRFSKNELIIEADNPEEVFAAIDSTAIESSLPENHSPLHIESRLTKEAYISVIQRLQQHILRGDCYEINFCQEFFAQHAVIDPAIVYEKLSAVSPNPFSALYRQQNSWLICASPERFIKKEGNVIVSQPIKGTAKRIVDDKDRDIETRQNLYQSKKDRSENVMVVDLVRNDLAKICKEGSVQVDELFGVYSFPQVHQMISTISGELDDNVSFADILKATFPMGSMTGAPKLKVMNLIDQYEQSRRGIFSGAIGYISPSGDFDFNVVIRSILYNAATQYVSFQAGSGITFYSDAANEWDECLLKAAAIKQVLDNTFA